MDISKSLKTSAIGGFKKEEVLSYIDQLVAQYEEERRNQAKELEEANSQIASLNSIVDEQYQKLMSLSAERDEFMVKAAKIDELQKLLAPYQNAQMTADEVIRQAKEKAQAAEEKLRLLLRDAQERANVIVSEANEKAKQITAAAEEEAQQRIESVKKEEVLLRQNAQHELDHAKEAAQQQLAEAANDLKTVLNAVSAGAQQSDAPDKNTRRCTARRGTLNQEDSPAAESVRNGEDGEGLLPVSGIADENIGRMLGKYFTSAD